jgi:TRAP-type C4-dicarboxylate transport system permease small subunit
VHIVLIKSNMKKTLTTVVGTLAGFWTPLLAAAQGGDLGAGVVQRYAPPARNLPATILGIVNFILIIVGVLALAYLVYGGFLYITSHGDESQTEKAKNVIVYAVVGILVIGIAAALVNFVIDAVLLGGR